MQGFWQAENVDNKDAQLGVSGNSETPSPAQVLCNEAADEGCNMGTCRPIS